MLPSWFTIQAFLDSTSWILPEPFLCMLDNFHLDKMATSFSGLVSTREDTPSHLMVNSANSSVSSHSLLISDRFSLNVKNIILKANN